MGVFMLFMSDFFFFFLAPWTICRLIIYRINIASIATKHRYKNTWNWNGGGGWIHPPTSVKNGYF